MFCVVPQEGSVVSTKASGNGADHTVYAIMNENRIFCVVSRDSHLASTKASRNSYASIKGIVSFLFRIIYLINIYTIVVQTIL